MSREEPAGHQPQADPGSRARACGPSVRLRHDAWPPAGGCTVSTGGDRRTAGSSMARRERGSVRRTENSGGRSAPRRILGMDLALHTAWHVWFRNLTWYRKTFVMNIVPNFFEPVLYLLGMGIGLGAYLGTRIHGVPYLEYIAPGLVAASAMNGASFHTTYNIFVALHYDKTYHGITATPVSIEDVALGEIFWAVTRSIIYGTAFFTITLVFGLVETPLALLVFPIIVLTGFLFGALGVLFTGIIKIIDLYSFYYTLFLTPLFLFSGIFFPLDALPEWAQSAAWLTPLFHCVEMMRAAYQGSLSAEWGLHLAYVLVVAAVFLVLGIRRFRAAFIALN
ncbi:MAG: ABC transporter permease [Candidatus Eisenbacteria bacterium]|nr:ABC transporter permease [Candidatus Eisenbacteria bacterium]